MSFPGDADRQQIVVVGTSGDIVARLASELGQRVAGIRSFELTYDAADRDLGEDEEPRPDEPVVWTCRAVVRRRWPGTTKPTDREFTGTCRVEPGGDHGHGIVEAAANLIEKFGGNVVLVQQ
jgi:hypothetical protein